MASINIRNLDEGLKKRLRLRAVKHGRSMEDEVRQILKSAVSTGDREPNLYDSIRALFEPLGGVDLPEFPDEPMRDPVTFD